MPLIVTVAPTAPLMGVKFAIVGVGNTVKLGMLKIVTPPVVTDILPVVVPSGTTTVMLEALDDRTVADTPLNDTNGDALKLLPLIVMMALAAPLVGVKLDMDGAGRTVKLDPLLILILFTVIAMSPVVAPAGTLVAILDVV